MSILNKLAQAFQETCIVVGRHRGALMIADLHQQLLPATQVKVSVGFQAEQQEGKTVHSSFHLARFDRFLVKQPGKVVGVDQDTMVSASP